MHGTGIAATVTVTTVAAGWRHLGVAERRRGVLTAVAAVTAAVASAAGAGGAAPRVVASAAGLTAVASWGHLLRRARRAPRGLCEGLISSTAAVAAAGARRRAGGGGSWTADVAWALAAIPVPVALAACGGGPGRWAQTAAPLAAATATGAALAVRACAAGDPRDTPLRGTAFDPVLAPAGVATLAAAIGTARLLGDAGAAAGAALAIAWGLVDPGAAGMAVAELARRADLGPAGTACMSAAVVSAAAAVRGAVAAAAAGGGAVRPVIAPLVAVPATAWAAAVVVAVLS